MQLRSREEALGPRELLHVRRALSSPSLLQRAEGTTLFVKVASPPCISSFVPPSLNRTEGRGRHPGTFFLSSAWPREVMPVISGVYRADGGRILAM